MSEIILFSLCLCLGVLSRLLFRLLVFIDKKMKNRPALIVLEFLLAGAIISSLILLIFIFNGGLFALYTLLGLFLGFALASLLV